MNNRNIYCRNINNYKFCIHSMFCNNSSENNAFNKRVTFPTGPYIVFIDANLLK